MEHKKLFFALGIVAWSGFVVAAYFVVQKPLALQVVDSLLALGWTFLVTCLLLLNALSLGLLVLRRWTPDAPQDAALLALASGLGLGGLGMLGFAFAAAGISNFYLLLIVQFLLLGWSAWKGMLQEARSLTQTSIVHLRSSGALLPAWMRWAVFLTVSLTFLLTLLPPADAFDALLYHLRVPELWIQDGGLRANDLPHYWFPSLVEGMYFWGLGLGSEIVAHQIHFVYALCTLILVWHWTRRIWGDMTAGWALMLLSSIPSLFLLASWAYTDLALIFFGLAMLYTLTYGRDQEDTRWWTLSAISAGLAMGVKYTSFIMPVAAVLLIAAWNFQQKRKLFTQILKFGLVSLATGCIWYLRNWIWMWNPIYPFLFGGRYWDEFRSMWFATPGTGTGWDIGALLLLPLTVTLGYQDINSIDADIGPLLLLALPLALWILFRRKGLEARGRTTLMTIGVFAFFSTTFWTCGYIVTHDLWQTRLLLPAVVPFVIPMAVGVVALRELDTKVLRVSFIMSVVAALCIYINLFDTALTVIARNPLAVAAGLGGSWNYLEKYQPGYAYARDAISHTTVNSKVYSLFEPRSYGMSRDIQPDPILDNFSHDMYLYGNSEGILRAWQMQGYTHILLNHRAASLVLEKAEEQAIFNATIASLKSVSKSPDGSYELLVIPFNDP